MKISQNEKQKKNERNKQTNKKTFVMRKTALNIFVRLILCKNLSLTTENGSTKEKVIVECVALNESSAIYIYISPFWWCVLTTLADVLSTRSCDSDDFVTFYSLECNFSFH